MGGPAEGSTPGVHEHVADHPGRRRATAVAVTRASDPAGAILRLPGRPHLLPRRSARPCIDLQDVVGIAPRLLWRINRGQWDLLGFEDINGRHADYAPGSADLPLIADAMRRLGEIPCPDLPLKKMSDRLRSYVDDTAVLASFDGDCLLHTDWNHANVLVTDRARLVDWAWASRGAGWIDPALWVIWLISCGHTPAEAEQWASRVPAWAGPPPEAVDAFAAASARLWDEIAGADPDEWTRRIQSAASTWSTHRRTAG
ncbi:phosphotransferase family protein [Streptomyces lydicus]|uniref:phosphotransferase family protein n=1 Tax=Streptomyces lydicus TaxID=47763 RepID=UPI0036FB2FB7